MLRCSSSGWNTGKKEEPQIIDLRIFTRAKDIFAQHKIDLSGEQLGQLDRYAELLVEWNQKMDLTAIADPQGILIKHFLDSILPFTLIPLAQNASLIDVGTGAGFPAIPLLIWRPDLQITLLDSLKKRLSFFGGRAVRMRSYGKNHP